MPSISTPEDLCNEALRAVGSPLAIGDMYEGSPQARACLEIYAQTRDEVLTTEDAKSFSRGVARLVVLKGPAPMGGYSIVQQWSPVYPPPGFLFEYAQPVDMIELRAIISPNQVLLEFDPQPITWRLDNDPTPIVVPGNPRTVTGPPQTVILANTGAAVAIYRRRVTDLTLWKPAALAAFISRMAAKLTSSPRFASSPQMMQTVPQEAMFAANVARGHRG